MRALGASATAGVVQEYITENGYPCTFVERAELIGECERISREVEAKVRPGGALCAAALTLYALPAGGAVGSGL